MTSPSTSMVPQQNGREISAPLAQWRSILLRLGYLVMAVGLVITKWPLLVNHVDPWPLFEGAETCMLVALSVLSLLGLRYPVKMLPIMLFEVAWKLLWLAIVALPAAWTGDIDAATLSFTLAVLWVVIIIAVIPWDFVSRQYVRAVGEPWRRTVVVGGPFDRVAAVDPVVERR